MRRRSEIISMGLSIAIAAVLLVQLLPSQSPLIRDLPKASKPAPMVPPKPITLATVPLPAPPPAPAPKQIAVVSVTTPTAASEIVTPLKPSPKEAAKPVGPVKTIEPLPKTADTRIEEATALKVEPIKPVKAAGKAMVTPLKPSPKEAAKPAGPVKTIEPLSKTADTRIEEAAPLKVEPIKPVKTAATAPAKPIIPLKKPTTTPLVSRPAPVKPAHRPTPPTVGTTDVTPLMATGRPLLRLLEHGDGPSIDIAWPRNARGREALFQSFAECYGMMVVLMASNGNLYSDRKTSGPWEINRDHYSGFVRQSGALGTTGERAWSRQILRSHPRASGSATIRVFPRAMDALLIGGLSRLLGEDYRAAKSIGARYVQNGNAILIDDIIADGLPIAGRIDLTAAGSRRCRALAKPKGI